MPAREDDQSDGDPAASARHPRDPDFCADNREVAPGEADQRRSADNRSEPIEVDIEAGGVGRFRVLRNRTQAQPVVGAKKKMRNDQGDRESEVDHDVLGEQYPADDG